MECDIIKLISGKVFLLYIIGFFFFCVLFILCAFGMRSYPLLFFYGGGCMIGDINLEVMVRFTAHFPGHVWAVN